MLDHQGRRLVFNPTAEEAIRQNNINYQPSKILAAFESDISHLMQYVDTSIDDRSDKYVTWSGSPTVDRQLLGLDGRWSSEKRYFFSRLTSVKVEEVLSRMVLPEWMRVEHLPLALKSGLEFDDSYKVCKSLWSSSGRGVIIDPEGTFLDKRRRFVEDHINNDGYAVQEVFLKKLVELAFLFYAHSDGTITFLGTNYYGSASNGAFGVEFIGVNPMEKYEDLLGADWEKISAKCLSEAIKEAIKGEDYHGYIGVDSMLYADNENKPHLRACVEVNLRMTMGNINLGIRKLFPKNLKAQWSIVFKKAGMEIPKTHISEIKSNQKGSFTLVNGEQFAAIGDIL